LARRIFRSIWGKDQEGGFDRPRYVEEAQTYSDRIFARSGGAALIKGKSSLRPGWKKITGNIDFQISPTDATKD